MGTEETTAAEKNGTQITRPITPEHLAAVIARTLQAALDDAENIDDLVVLCSKGGVVHILTACRQAFLPSAATALDRMRRNAEGQLKLAKGEVEGHG